MIIKFGYYNDEDFGLTAFPEIKFSEKEISKNNKTHWLTDEPVSIRQKGDYQVPTIFDG